MSSLKPNALRPLRVALVGSSLRLGGAEKQTAFAARALSEAGTNTHFFYLGEGGYYETGLRRMGIGFQRIYQRNRPMIILAQLIKAFCRFQPQIVFAPQFGDLCFAGLAGRLCHALTLGGLRSDGNYEFNTHGWRSRWMLRLAHGLIANSHCAQSNLLSRVTNPPGIRVLPNVLDLSEFDARSRMPLSVAIPSQRAIAVTVGSLQPGKRFDRFLEALALARRVAPNLLGVIAGADCGCRLALEQQARALGLLPNHVLFLGECDNIPALMVQAGFLVLCSDYEGFPNVILEAMAASLPVISTRVGDVSRVVCQGQTGYVVEVTDLEGMAERMVELALLPATRTRLGSAGRVRVVQEYNQDSLPDRLISVLHDFALLNRRHQLADCLQNLRIAKLPQASGEAQLSCQCVA